MIRAPVSSAALMRWGDKYLAGDDGPFRLCSPAAGDLVARHDMPTAADVVTAPPGWWAWWGTEATPAAQPIDTY